MYAKIDNGVVVEICVDPATTFHPMIAREFISVADDVVVGMVKQEDGSYALPDVSLLEVATPEPTELPVAFNKVSPIEFKLLFTSAERVAIKVARATDAVIDDFYDIVEDPRLTHVDLGLQSTKDAIAYMVSKTLLTQDRADTILSGTFV